MPKWLNAALDYIPRWPECQLRYHEQPGCVLAVAYKGDLVLEEAFGHADLARAIALRPVIASASPRIRRASPRPP
jgi:D-alanyl-D-alanine carboxypeptidase